jgi:hypothetical protein
VEQTLNYNIANEPLTAITLLAPRMTLTPDNLRASLEGAELTWSELATSITADDNPPRSRINIALPSARIGACRLVLTYSLPLPVPTPGKPTPWNVPLVRPDTDEGTSFESRTARIYTTVETLRVEATGDRWNGDESAPVDDGLTLVAEPDAEQLPLEISLLKPQRQASSIVSQGWVRTWLNDTVRQDRAVFRISSSERSSVRIRLPAGARLEQVAVDGRQLLHPSATDQQLVVDVPPGESVVELWYDMDRAPKTPWGRTSLTLPRVAGAAWAKRLYWQLAVPRDEHLWLAPAGMTPELTWRWHELFGDFGYWDRQSNLDQRQLEQLLGASRQAPLPAGANQYLFSTFELPQQVEFSTASRLTMLLLASGLVVCGGLLLIYIPVLRHPAVLLVVSIAVVAVALLYPEPAIQFAQAAVLGVVVLLAARLANWAITRQREQSAVVRGTSLVPRETNTTETRRPQVEADSQMSTATAALAAHGSGGESNG